ncbi:hypothetical protein C8R44DRAFT_992596, partial [Mycena epipterygia]
SKPRHPGYSNAYVLTLSLLIAPLQYEYADVLPSIAPGLTSTRCVKQAGFSSLQCRLIITSRKAGAIIIKSVRTPHRYSPPQGPSTKSGTRGALSSPRPLPDSLHAAPLDLRHRTRCEPHCCLRSLRARARAIWRFGCAVPSSSSRDRVGSTRSRGRATSAPTTTSNAAQEHAEDVLRPDFPLPSSSRRHR